MPKVKILTEKCDGYERLYELELIATGEIVYAYGVDHSNYIEKENNKQNLGVIKDGTFSIEWVNKLKRGHYETSEIIQTRDGSSHCECKLPIVEILDSDTFMSYYSMFGNIVIELESDNNEIVAGDKVIFMGNLRVDF